MGQLYKCNHSSTSTRIAAVNAKKDLCIVIIQSPETSSTFDLYSVWADNFPRRGIVLFGLAR